MQGELLAGEIGMARDRPHTHHSRAVRMLNPARLLLARRTQENLREHGERICWSIERALGRELTDEDFDCAEALSGCGIVQCFDWARNDAGLALALAAAIHRGEICHVLSTDDSCFAAATRLAAALDAMGIRWAALDRPDPRIAIRQPQVLFAPIRNLALTRLGQFQPERGMPSTVRDAARRLFAGKYSQARLRSQKLDFGIVLDVDEMLCRRAMTAIVHTKRSEEDNLKLHRIQDTFGLAAQMRPRDHFRIGENAVSITAHGRNRLSDLARCLGPEWSNPIETEILVANALEVMFIWRKGEDYRVSAEKVEVLSQRLLERCGRHDHRMPLLDIIAAKEAVQDNGKAEDRITIRSMLLLYGKRAGFAKHKARYVNELSSVYGMRNIGRNSMLAPDIVVFDLKTLADSLEARVRKGCLCIVEATGDRDSELLRDMLRSREVPVVEQEQLAASSGSRAPENSVMWIDAAKVAESDVIDEIACAFETVLLVSLNGLEFRPAADARRITRVAMISSKNRVIRTMVAFISAVPGLKRLLMPVIWRQLQYASNSNEAALRNQLHQFDQSCRRAVDFARVNDW